jgi:hypothetical protein
MSQIQTLSYPLSLFIFSIAGAAVSKPVPTVAMIFPAISHFDAAAAATAKLVNNIMLPP